MGGGLKKKDLIHAVVSAFLCKFSILYFITNYSLWFFKSNILPFNITLTKIVISNMSPVLL